MEEKIKMNKKKKGFEAFLLWLPSELLQEFRISSARRHEKMTQVLIRAIEEYNKSAHNPYGHIDEGDRNENL